MNEKIGYRPHIHWTKDGGVDVIAWKSFDDRANQIILLIQCATGDNWYQKIGEIHIETWKRWIYFSTPPIEAFAFPFVANTLARDLENEWLERCGGKLFLDRLRLASFNLPEVNPDLVSSIENWCETQIVKLPVDE